MRCIVLVRAFLILLVSFAWTFHVGFSVNSVASASEKGKEGEASVSKGEGETTHHVPMTEKGVGTGLVPGIPDEHGNVSPWRLDLSIYSFVVFLTLLAILTKYAWGPIIKALDAREEGIRKDIANAKQTREKADSLLAEHAKKLDSAQDEVREIIAEAKRDAEHTKSDIITNAQNEARLTQDRAVDEIERAKDQALNELFSNMSTQVATATEQVIGRALTEDDRKKLVGEAVSQFSSNSLINRMSQKVK